MRALLMLMILVVTAAAQMPPNQDFAPPSPFTPDEATLKAIATKTGELKEMLAALEAKVKPDAVADVAIYLKAAEWIVKHNEWYTKDSGKQTLTTLDAGQRRAEALKAGKTPWRDIRGKPVVRAYISEIDGSIQPYSVTLPEGYGTDGKKYRKDIVLHGRDATISEVKFIATREGAKPAKAGNDFVVLEPYGRGNNAYRWAGERDVFEVWNNFVSTDRTNGRDDLKPVIRGFSMGGAGTWHLGLQHPFEYSVMSPGAGFTVTRGYVKNLPATLPDYVERCLHIYDAADYAENAVNIPIVAYSGELDPQRAAVTNVEKRWEKFPEKLRYTHIIGTGLEHKQPPEWWAKVDEQIRKERAALKAPQRAHFVTYTPRYSVFGFGAVITLERLYEKATVDSVVDDKSLTLTTSNVAALMLWQEAIRGKVVLVDGQVISRPANLPGCDLERRDGQWMLLGPPTLPMPMRKRPHFQGPIDDAFMQPFQVIDASQPGGNAAMDAQLKSVGRKFDTVWNKYQRGVLPRGDSVNGAMPVKVFFGDPVSNPELAAVINKLPLTWTPQTLTVHGKSYDAKTHYPAMVYPNPQSPGQYLVLNSGHTFGEADFKGTNALLYPRLGDWAVLKLAPTKADPHATEVVDAGIFDSNWQFEKRK